MDVNFIRKLNLLRLIEQEGGLRKFAGKIGSDESYISTILSDASKRNAGDELMRRVEKVYKLPDGALDFPDYKMQLAMMKLITMPEEKQQATLDFIGYQFNNSDLSLFETPGKLTEYLKMIAKMIDDQEKRKRKKDDDDKGEK
jgi:hypothetical protein